MMKVVLFRGKDRSLERKHPWIFSGAIHHVEGNPEEGDWVDVVTAGGQLVGAGFYEAEGSIRVRMVWWGRQSATVEAALRTRVLDALQLRSRIGLIFMGRFSPPRLHFLDQEQRLRLRVTRRR